MIGSRGAAVATTGTPPGLGHSVHAPVRSCSGRAGAPSPRQPQEEAEDPAVVDELVRDALAVAAGARRLGAAKIPASALARATGLAQRQVERALARLAAAGMAQRRLDWSPGGGIRALWCMRRDEAAQPGAEGEYGGQSLEPAARKPAPAIPSHRTE